MFPDPTHLIEMNVCYQASPELHNDPGIRCVGAGKQAGQWVPKTRVEKY